MNKSTLASLIKAHLGELLHQDGFFLYGNDIAYKVNGSIFQGLYFNLNSSGEMLTIDIFVMPLFEKREHIGWNLGSRIGLLVKGKDYWWSLNDQYVNSSMSEISVAIKDYAMPWLVTYESPKKIIAALGEAKTHTPADLNLLAYCAMWEGEWETALTYLAKQNGLFQSSDDRRTFVIERNRLNQEFTRLILDKKFQEISDMLHQNVDTSKNVLQLKSKTKTFNNRNSKGPRV